MSKMVDVLAAEVPKRCPSLQLSSHMTDLVHAATFKLRMSFLMGKNFCLQTSRVSFRKAVPNPERITNWAFLLHICELLSCLRINISTPGYLLIFAINVLFAFQYRCLKLWTVHKWPKFFASSPYLKLLTTIYVPNFCQQVIIHRCQTESKRKFLYFTYTKHR
jgi:hypothetical protein